MMIPERLEPLLREGTIQGVSQQLMSGKEAAVYVVSYHGEDVCAKVYKETNKRSFKHTSQYTEGRKMRNSRRSRAVEKKSKFGRREQEDAWHNAEVLALNQLLAAGVRVPKVFHYQDGVILMELITGVDDGPAPRLVDIEFTKQEALDCHQKIVRDLVRMLHEGMVHGDLSEYNVLMGKDGHVIIDLPQVIYASGNNNAARLFERDAENMAAFFSKFAPELEETKYGKEIWSLYKSGRLKPDSKLKGQYQDKSKVDIRKTMRVIEDIKEEEMLRRKMKDED